MDIKIKSLTRKNVKEFRKCMKETQDFDPIDWVIENIYPELADKFDDMPNAECERIIAETLDQSRYKDEVKN